jgi:hypothetical protein
MVYLAQIPIGFAILEIARKRLIRLIFIHAAGTPRCALRFATRGFRNEFFLMKRG